MTNLRLPARRGHTAHTVCRKSHTGVIGGRLLALFILCCCTVNLMADDLLMIDDRRSGQLDTVLGVSWRLATDRVMGGVSRGQLSSETVDNKACLRLTGDVRLDNNGGFIQAALDVEGTAAADAFGYDGILLGVHGNDQQYNLHLRTSDAWLPWQSWRATFYAPARWQTVKLPFTEFSGYRTRKKLDLKRLERIGIVAIGRAFSADLCIGELAFYRDMD